MGWFTIEYKINTIIIHHSDQLDEDVHLKPTIIQHCDSRGFLSFINFNLHYTLLYFYYLTANHR